MCYHFGFWNWTAGQPLARALGDHAPAWGEHLHFGWIGVEVFFVISGFVIAYTTSDARPSGFLRSRILRLAPVNWIGATLVLLTQCVTQLTIGQAWLPTLLVKYVETLVFWPLNAIDGVWWTLGIEIDFYLLAYLLIRKGRAASLETIIVAIGCLSGAFWAAALALQTLLDGRVGLLGTLHTLVLKAEGNRELQLLLIQHGSLFALGVVLWTVSTAGLTRRRVGIIMALTVGCLLEIIGQNGIIARAAHMPLPAWPAILAWSAAMTFLGLSIVFNGALARRIGRGAGAIRFAGLTTYPLYLTHNATGIATILVLAPQWGFAAIGAGIATSFAGAVVVAAFVEPWLRGQLARLLSRPPRAGSGGPPASLVSASASR
jgi:peptidoglycan/LPS O-acetylase OafA/YrhL